MNEFIPQTMFYITHVASETWANITPDTTTVQAGSERLSGQLGEYDSFRVWYLSFSLSF